MKNLLRHLFCLALAIVFCASINAQYITTIAGTGVTGVSGDGGFAVAAQINYCFATTMDAAGNLYLADRLGNNIRKITPAGIITTFAGGGTGPDGGPASSAALSGPSGIAIDLSGNVFFSEFTGGHIRKVNPSGIISTFATGLINPTGVATDASGNLYVGNLGARKVMKVTPAGVMTTFAGTGVSGFSGDGFAATNANISSVTGVAADGFGNVYIACQDDGHIRKVNSSGIITTVAGLVATGFSGDNGPAISAQLNTPYGLSTDASGNLYIADLNNFRSRKITASTGIITTVAGTGIGGYNGDGIAATDANIIPLHVFAAPGGALYITESNRIRKVAPCVGGAPIVDVIAGPSSVCQSNTITLTDDSLGGVWSSSNSGVATVGTSGIVTGVTSGTANILYTIINSCTGTTVGHLVTVNAGPSAITITPFSTATVCLGTDALFTAFSTSPISVLDQDFNSGMTGAAGGTWTVINSGAVSPHNWSITPSGGLSDIVGLVGDGTSFIAGDPDLAGAGVNINTTLYAPSFSTVGLSSVSLSYNYYVQSSSSYDSSVEVDYSIDGGTNWILLVPYLNATSGTQTWAAGTPNFTSPLPLGMLAQPDVRLKWKYNSLWGFYWAIDNVLVSAQSTSSFSWTGIGGATGLACTACASQTITPTVAGLNTYSVTATSGGCSSSKTVTVNVLPLPAPAVITGPATICIGSTVTLGDVVGGGAWSSTSPIIASIDLSGNLTAVSIGTTNISYTISNACGTRCSYPVRDGRQLSSCKCGYT
jgi:hypothetical protein